MPHPNEPHPDEPRPDAPHPDVDDLALAALGESLDNAAQAHIADCAGCTAQIESFRGTIGLAGLSDYGRDAPAPGEHVWDAIADELGFVGGIGSPDPPPAPPTPLSVRRTAPSSGTRWHRWAAPLAAAVVGIAVGAGAVILVQNRQDTVTVDATAPLTPVPDGPLPSSDGQLGVAELVTAQSGQRVRVAATGLPAATSTAYEVWLFGDDGRMVALGTLADGMGSFTVPAGIDTQEYRTVDISDEPADGDPAHSGISVVRGTFT